MLRRVVDAAAESRAEIGAIARRIRDEIVAPAIERAAMRIGESVGHVGFEFARGRLEAIDRRVEVPDRTAGGFHLGAVKDAVAQVNRSTRLVGERVGLVVRIRGIESHQHPLLPVGPAVAVGVAHEPEIRRLKD